MNGWIWFGIVVVVLGIAWISIRKKKDSGYGTSVRNSSSSGGFWGAVKDACCIRNR